MKYLAVRCRSCEKEFAVERIGTASAVAPFRLKDAAVQAIASRSCGSGFSTNQSLHRALAAFCV